MKKTLIVPVLVLALSMAFISGCKKAPEGRIDRTQPRVFSADETADVGIDLATPVVERIGAEKKSEFTGSIPKVTIEIKYKPIIEELRKV